MKSNGVFFFDPNLGENKIDRFRDDVRKDKFWQAAMTIQGKIGNFDVTYAGAYMDRRLAQASAGEIHVVVDHADLLVLP